MYKKWDIITKRKGRADCPGVFPVCVCVHMCVYVCVCICVVCHVEANRLNHLLADEVLLSGLIQMAGCPADSPEHECATGQQLVFTSDVGLCVFFFSVEADKLWISDGNVLACPRSERMCSVCTGSFFFLLFLVCILEQGK